MQKEAKILMDLFSNAWWNNNHLKAIQKSDEFWFKYNKMYDTFSQDEQEIYLNVCWEGTYRQKYLTEKERKKYEDWLDKLIPDNYFDK